MNETLYPHQKDIISFCIKAGRAAVFGQFGLGKTAMQIELMQHVLHFTGKPVLIGLPLAVKQEFLKDARRMGYNNLHYAKDQGDVKKPALYLTNYERIREGKFDALQFGGVSLDEASVIRSMGTQTTQYILSHFNQVPYRYVFTATPSPNEYHELLKYADFLGIMDISQALNRFFKRDSVKAHNSSLLGHREKDFWLWMHSWAVFVTKPSDINPDYSDAGYDLPELKVFYHEVKVKDRSQSTDRDGNPTMFADPSRDLSAAAKEKRESLADRIAEMQRIVSATDDAKFSGPRSGDHFIIWHHLENERKAIEKALGENCRSVYGSQSQDEKETLLMDFSEGGYRYLATKPEIAGQGCNFQYHCHKAIFLGINYQFNDFIQAIHRIYRFQQSHPVEIHIIYTDSEYSILKALKAKWDRHNRMVQKMVDIIREHGLAKREIDLSKGRSFSVKRKELKGKNFHAINNDSVLECAGMASDSIGLTVSSIPFSDMFEYAESYCDMGQSNGDAEFFEHLDYLTPNTYRITQPGRFVCIHVKDAIKYSYQNGLGFTKCSRFSDRVADHYEKHGFAFMGRITVTTDVVQENAQTYRLGWSERCKDGTKMGVGLPEYILLFRKPPSNNQNAYADIPVSVSKNDFTRGHWQVDAHSFWKSDGNRFLSSEELKRFGLDRVMRMWKEHDRNHLYDYKEHYRTCEQLDGAGKLPSKFMALPPQSNSPFVWDDIVRMKTLNTSQAVSKKIKHVCPLQIDIVDRLIEWFSNPGDNVLDMFAGIFTVPLRADALGRYGIGIELSNAYYNDGCGYLKAQEYKKNLPLLFEMLETKSA